jgi:NADH-quinone oxidoreductase subunit C
VDRSVLVDEVRQRFGERILEVDLEATEPYLRIAAEDWPDVARFLRDHGGLDYLACLTAIDRGEELEAVYNVERMDAARLGISVRIAVPRDDPRIPTVEKVWRTADWHEREAFDLMGIVFAGHHNLVRILCAEDWEGHPLRKDYRSPDYYHGVRNNVV